MKNVFQNGLKNFFQNTQSDIETFRYYFLYLPTSENKNHYTRNTKRFKGFTEKTGQAFIIGKKMVDVCLLKPFLELRLFCILQKTELG